MVVMGIIAEIFGKVVVDPFLEREVQEVLSTVKRETKILPVDNVNTTYGDGYMMAAMYQDMGNDL